MSESEQTDSPAPSVDPAPTRASVDGAQRDTSGSEAPDSRQVPSSAGGGPPAVDLVIPVYNEERDLAQSVAALRQRLLDDKPGWKWRIVVADNASTDGTLDIARELAERWPGQVGFVHLDQKGRGRALRRAWTESDADIVCYMDVDLSTDLSALAPLVESLRGGYDVAIGSRLLPESRTTRGLKRDLISRAYNLIIQVTHGVSFRDAQCGFKGVTRRVVNEIVPLVQDPAWFFDTELLLIADRKGYKIKELPVTWTDDPDSRVKIGKTAWEDLKGLWRLKWHFPGEPVNTRPLKMVGVSVGLSLVGTALGWKLASILGMMFSRLVKRRRN